jgi:hypothetical protein
MNISRADRWARIAQLEHEIRLSVLEELAARLELTFLDNPGLPKVMETLAAIRYDWGGAANQTPRQPFEEFTAGGGQAPSRPQG